jgi:hypothetical protein
MEPEGHCIVHKSSSLVPALSHTNPVHTTHPISSRCVLILSTHLRLGLSSALLPSDFRTSKLHAFLDSHIRATCPAHPIIYRFHKSPSLVPVNPINPVHTNPSYAPTYFLVFLVDFFLLAFEPITFMHPRLPHTCYMPCPYILLHVIILILLGEDYTLWSS